MKNYPKHINNREEFLNNILENRKIWEYVKDLESEADGINNNTNKVVIENSMEETRIYQAELIDDMSLISKYDLKSFDELKELIKTLEG
jgi:hypothetical protein